VAVVTGSRADFGLLAPVMRAVATRPDLELLVIAAGSHLIQPAETFRDVKAHFDVADSVPMQIAGRTGRFEDAESTGRGIARFARSFHAHRPDWVVVLGDRIEAFAAAAAASIAGIAVAHLHGGDRAEGVADEAMRHAITKLAHLHLPATQESAERILRVGERPEHVRLVGSPALDDLAGFEPLPDEVWDQLGRPRALLLMHPIGRHDEAEEAAAACVIEGIRAALPREPVLALDPNHDPGRNGVIRAIKAAAIPEVSHLPRQRFAGLLKRLAATHGVLVGNSSAALIEAAALGVPAVDVGRRQAGRERPASVQHAEESAESVSAAITRALAQDLRAIAHPYGDGQAGARAAAALAEIDPTSAALLRKRCVY
jgi:UDP-hydrolysing UDP-N-acetyl-D-glucosamine 2-epimerase